MNATYTATRNTAALFDFSEEGRFYISGDDCVPFINALISTDLDSIQEFTLLNTLFLNKDGTILAIVWVLKDEERIIILTEPDRRQVVTEHLNTHRDNWNIEISDETERTRCLAVIGPQAQEITREVADDDIVGLSYLGFEWNEVVDALLCRIGYVGEYEYRFIVPTEQAQSLENRIVEKGKDYDLEEQGDLSVLSVLKLEMRSLNQQRDVPPNVTAIQAGLHWMIDFRKDEFIGRDAIHEQKKAKGRKLLTLLFDGEDLPPIPSEVFIEEQKLGKLVNVEYSPTVGKSIGLAYIDEDLAYVGISFYILVNDKTLSAQSVSAPLFITNTVKGISQ